MNKFKNSISLLISLVIILFNNVILVQSHTHRCIYDELATQYKTEIVDYPRLSIRDTNEYQLFLNETESIRIQIYTDSLLASNDVGYSCESANQQITVNSLPYTCKAEDVLPSKVRTYLINTLLKKAKDVLQSTLYIERMTTPITINSMSCASISLPSSYQTPGVPVDLVLLVTARPIKEDGTLAYARDCQALPNRRSIVGHLNFDPSSVSLEESVKNFQYGVAIHEISHVLGFNYDKMDDIPGMVTNYNKNITANGSTVNNLKKITSPKVVEYIRKHFNCPTLDGAELEDQGGPGTANSHWEKRIFNNEYMTGTASHYPIFSNLTLALFEDLGYYAIDHKYAQTLVWGNGLGCSFAAAKCSEWDNNLLFCEDASAGDQCTYDRVAKGTCSIRSQNVDPAYQWISGEGGDELPDFCPSYDGYSNAYCVDDTIPDNNKDYISAAEVFGPNSRCFTSSLLRNVPVSIKSEPRCYETACQAVNKLKIKVSSFWYNCPYDETIEIEGFGGKLTCPTGNELCMNVPTDNTWPIFKSIEPTSAEPGDIITITGENFNNSTYIEIDEHKCEDTKIVNSTFLIATISSEYIDFTSVIAEKDVNVYVVNSDSGKNDVGVEALAFRIPLNEAYLKRVGNWLKTHWYVAVIGGLAVIGLGIFIWKCCCSKRKTNNFSKKSSRLSTKS